MYRLNTQLLSAIPSILGVTVNEMSEKAGIGINAYRTWVKADEPNMSVQTFVDFLNAYRLSFADFLVVEGQRKDIIYDKDYYVTPKDVWQEIVFNNENISRLYGRSSLTGIAEKGRLAHALGLASPAPIRSWVLDKGALHMKYFLKILNTFHVDPKLFIQDPNKNVVYEIPVEAVPENLVAKIEESSRKDKIISEKEYLISELRKTIAVLKEENRKLAAAKAQMADTLAESRVAYGMGIQGRGWYYHEELVKCLPDIWGLSVNEFTRLTGVNMYRDDANIPMDDLIHICNTLHISMHHFFPPNTEPKVVYGKGRYEVTGRSFHPIESRLENMQYLFGKYSVLGESVENLTKRTGVGRTTYNGMKSGKKLASRPLSVAEICTKFNIPPSMFFEDDNVLHRPTFSESQNELLLKNCIQMKKDLEELKRILKSK